MCVCACMCAHVCARVVRGLDGAAAWPADHPGATMCVGVGAPHHPPPHTSRCGSASMGPRAVRNIDHALCGVRLQEPTGPPSPMRVTTPRSAAPATPSPPLAGHKQLARRAQPNRHSAVYGRGEGGATPPHPPRASNAPRAHCVRAPNNHQEKIYDVRSMGRPR